MKLTKDTATVYRLRRSEMPGESFAWADITIRSWKNGGSVDAQSDYGSYAYSWNATGCDDIRKFLVKIGFDYFMSKAHPEHGYERDWEATANKIKRQILESRREGGLGTSEAREAWDAVGQIEHDDGFFWQAREYPSLHEFLAACEYPTADRRIPQCDGFWRVIWPEIVKVWQEEMAAEAVAAPHQEKEGGSE